jgi:hypothetical protein
MFCPPGVKTQFKMVEAPKFGYDVNIVNEEDEIINGINITNYERLTVRVQIEDYERDIYFKYWKDYEPIEVKRVIVYDSDGKEIKRRIKELEDQIGNSDPDSFLENVAKEREIKEDINLLSEQLGHHITGTKIEVMRFRFNPSQFAGISLDEASVLKHHDAKTRERITRYAKNIPFRLCATATPAPNDFFELSNYAEFLGIMNGRQIKANYFIQDGNTSNQFRLKKPAEQKWWQFVAEWAIIIEKPSDLGYSDDGFVLPDFETRIHIIKDNTPAPGALIPMPAKTLSDTEGIKRRTIKERMEKVAEIANADDDHKLIFIRRNPEGVLLNKLIPGSVEVAGRHSDAVKEERLIGFAQGKYKVLITKPSIGGFGLNMQGYCYRVISGNVNYSNEEKYQYERRVWRFGQENKVIHDIVAMDTEDPILSNLSRKEKQMTEMTREVVKHMDIHDLSKVEKTKRTMEDYKEDEFKSEYWRLLLGDSCKRVAELINRSIDIIMTSVPFPAMYAYTDLDEDIGNYETAEDLCEHLRYVFAGLLPKMKPGGIAHIHIAQGVAFQNRHGYAGLWDFRGPLVKMMRDCGWEFYSEITIEKDPQTQAARNKSHPLMQKTVFSNAAMLGASVPDYLLLFKAPGEKENVKSVQSYYPDEDNNNYKHNALLSDPAIQGKYVSPDGWITMDMWINWASNVWLMHRKGMKWWEGINVTNVLGSLLNSKRGTRGR